MASSEVTQASRSAADLQAVIFLVAVTQVVAYPLGLHAAAALAMGVQFVAWAPSASAKNEKFFDFVGMISFITLSLYSCSKCIARFFVDAEDGPGMSPAAAFAVTRHGVATLLVLIWTLRLGTFLFQRICKDGHDSRFNGVRDHPTKFLVYFSLQGLWVFMTPLPMLALHKFDPTGKAGEMGIREAIGLGVWILGFMLEVAADNQKRAFKADAANKGRHIDVGLWSRCRHPNYVGEMVIWVGFFVFCSRGVLEGAGWTAVAGPAFVIFLFLRLATPLLEEISDKKYGGHAQYHEYKRRTPSLYFRL